MRSKIYSRSFRLITAKPGSRWKPGNTRQRTSPRSTPTTYPTRGESMAPPRAWSIQSPRNTRTGWRPAVPGAGPWKNGFQKSMPVNSSVLQTSGKLKREKPKPPPNSSRPNEDLTRRRTGSNGVTRNSTAYRSPTSRTGFTFYLPWSSASAKSR